jgi:hypothetical protein
MKKGAMHMKTLNILREKNPKLNIIPVTDPSFDRYGRILTGIQVEGLIKAVKDYVKMPDGNVVYEASIPQLEEDKALIEAIEQKVYGEMPIQIGLCYGWNTKLNGVEYHKGNETIVAVTDIILLLGDYRDVKFGDRITYDTSLIEAYYVEARTVVELYTSSLHYAPVHVSEETGFIAVIILPRGTNEELEFPVERTGENILLTAVNKWLIVHPDVASTGYVGLNGENTEVVPL